MIDWLFDTSGFPPRWHCGIWPPSLGYLHILSDIAIWGAYMSIPLALLYFVVRNKHRVPFPPLFWLFAAFIFFCGTTHLVDAAIFYTPVYRLSGILKLGTALVSWATVFALIQYMPMALMMPKLASQNKNLKKQVKTGKRREFRLEERVQERTAELEKALEELRLEVEERRRTEQLLRKREAQLMAAQRQLEMEFSDRSYELNRQIAINSAIVNSSDDAIVGKNLNGEIISWNGGAEKTYGFTEEEAIGQNIRIVLLEDRQNEAQDLIRRILAGETIRHFETIRKRKDGTRIHVSLTFSPLTIESGEIVGVSAIERDITDEVHSREKLEEYAQKLEQSNQDLQQFAYVASHDLKAPLRAVSGYVQLLERRYGDQLDEDAKKFIHGAVESVTQMQELINALLSFSRIQRADKKLASVDLNTVVEKAKLNLTMDIRESMAEVNAEKLPAIQGDFNLIVQLFQNLIGNAIKFRDERVPEVRITSEEKRNEWIISVADNGIGIDPRYADKVFEIFKRLHSARKYKGTGIGLAICKRIVDHHGGAIWIESEPGKGSTFYISFPKKR